MLYQLSYTPAQAVSPSRNSQFAGISALQRIRQAGLFPGWPNPNLVKLFRMIVYRKAEATVYPQVATGIVAIFRSIREATTFATPTLRRQK